MAKSLPERGSGSNYSPLIPIPDNLGLEIFLDPRHPPGTADAGMLVAAERQIAADRYAAVDAEVAAANAAGDPKIPIIYEVDRIRDGRSFTTRRVVAIQHGQAIFAMSVSFHVPEAGLDHRAEMPNVPGPESLPSDTEIRQRVLPMMPDAVRRYYERERPIELRPVEFERYLGRKFPEGKFNVWIRTTGPLPDAATTHQCVLAYASDLMLLDASLMPHGRTVFDKTVMAASLDHALWFHRPFKSDEWLLYAQDSPNASGARGFARGLIFSRDGTLVASVAQEGLIRERRKA